ncbi:MAG TPA: tRNA lysidine(34) synthetase TilS [Myxococcales bacterium]|nr:tRNA lysidine(34) synthetase TilS [Myxococcales bacterium]
MHGFIQKVQKRILNQTLIEPGARVVAAVSGGADSTAMALALCALGYQPKVVHVNHGVSSASSQWADFVADFARSNGCEFELLSCDSGRGSEAEMRDGRYGAFDTLAAGLIATAHTADDQAETVLLRIIRGSGSVGLSAIPPKRGRFIRPLLSVSRSEVLAYLEAGQQEYIHDPSNDCLDPLRNRVRHVLLPLLKSDFQPQIVRHLTRIADITRSERSFLEAKATEHLERFGLKIAALRDLHAGIRPHVIRAASPVAISSERLDAIERLVTGGSGAVQLEGGITVKIDRVISQLIFRPTKEC